MTEYWVSQAKYYCKYCKQWMADNKASRQLHDMSEKHKNNVEYYHKKKRDDKLHGARSERELQQQMEAINRAAQSAVTSDMSENAGLFYTKNQFHPPHLQHGSHGDLPHAHHNNKQDPAQSSWSTGPSSMLPTNVSESTDKAISENLREDNSGIYTVNGVTYLEGQYHEDKLVADALCELFVESEDEWCKAIIVRSRVVAIAHTELETKSFDVNYVPASFDEWNEENSIVELEVKSDRIRLIQAPPVAPETKIDADTGLGVWETVSVRVFDEAEEKRQIEERKQKEENKEGKAKERQDDIDNSAISDNAMSSFDVYNTGMYKGVEITKSEASSRKIAEEMESVANGKEVGFKKRKASNSAADNRTVKGKKRNIRKKTDDND